MTDRIGDGPIARAPVPVATRSPTGRTNAYVVGHDDAVLVDPGARTDALDDLVEDRTVAHVVLTHTHPDHVGAVADYAATREATVWARAGREDRFVAATGLDPDHTFREGTTVLTGDGAAVTVIETPGHAPDHVAFAVAAGGQQPAPGCERSPVAVLCGDLAVAEGSVVVGAPEGDLRAYLTSLRRLRALDPPRLLPGHGPPVDDPRATIERLLSHRLERERRIREAVDGGARTLPEILATAYEKDLAGVRDLAERTVVAHLEKLAVEGDLVWNGERARPAGGNGADPA